MRRVARGLRRIPKRVADVAAIARGSQWSPTAMHGVRIPPVRRRWVPRSLLPTIKKDFRTCDGGPREVWENLEKLFVVVRFFKGRRKTNKKNEE